MTAVGDLVGKSNAKKSVCLITGQTATNGQPTLATDGVPCFPTTNAFTSAADGVCFMADPAGESSIFVKVVGSGGTVAGTFRLWGYHVALAEWVPVGTGADTTKGTLNAGASIGATKTNKALHCEPFWYPGHFDRLYLEVVAISGTSAAAEAWITVPRET